MVVFWVVTAVVGLALAALSSTRGVDHAVRAAGGLGVPTFVVGFTVVSLGTDLPEIANSVVAAATGHGDVGVGNSIGSVAAQTALVLGLVPLLARPIVVDRHNVLLLGGATTGLLLFGVALMADGGLGRVDGTLLVGGWAVAVWQVYRRTHLPAQQELPLPARRPGVHVLLAACWLLLVVGGATVAVVGLTRAAAALAVPEYLVSFLGLALGTSLPELTVVVTAVRRGQADLAVGDALGASLADASLSAGIGPLVFPVTLTAGLVVPGGLATSVLVGAVVGVLALRGRLGRVVGLLFVAAYLAMVPTLVASA